MGIFSLLNLKYLWKMQGYPPIFFLETKSTC